MAAHLAAAGSHPLVQDAAGGRLASRHAAALTASGFRRDALWNSSPPNFPEIPIVSKPAPPSGPVVCISPMLASSSRVVSFRRSSRLPAIFTPSSLSSSAASSSSSLSPPPLVDLPPSASLSALTKLQQQPTPPAKPQNNIFPRSNHIADPLTFFDEEGNLIPGVVPPPLGEGIVFFYPAQHAKALRELDAPVEEENRADDEANGPAEGILPSEDLPTNSNMKRAKQYICPVENCGRRFADRSGLKYHNLSHTGERRYKCDQCPSTFKVNTQLTAHRTKVHAENRDAKTCNDCGRAYLRNHSCQKAVPTKSNKRKRISGGEDASEDEESSNSAGRLDLDDPDNGYSGDDPDDEPLPAQMATLQVVSDETKNASTEDSTVKTDMLTEGLDRDDDSPLAAKVNAIGPSHPRPCPNKGCSATFTDSAAFISHMLNHSSISRPSFKTKFPPGISFKAEELNTGGVQYTCGVCGDGYDSYNYLALHTQQVHGASLSTSRDPLADLIMKSEINPTTGEPLDPFNDLERLESKNARGNYYVQCIFCQKKFYRKNDIKSHLVSHSVDRPFGCEVAQCEAAFARRHDLFRHYRMKHHVSPPPSLGNSTNISAESAGAGGMVGSGGLNKRHRVSSS
ncbi:hypothetical protein DFJ73DRAFT_836874 [Zopfochytrium polystomum]|nr:hypothetical protein DFJ73DRAFT_836874 [Zopfochytrium polystomum]